jgi:hypothetical protein
MRDGAEANHSWRAFSLDADSTTQYSQSNREPFDEQQPLSKQPSLSLGLASVITWAPQAARADFAHLTLQSQSGDFIGQGGAFDIVYSSNEISAQIRRTLPAGPAPSYFSKVAVGPACSSCPPWWRRLSELRLPTPSVKRGLTFDPPTDGFAVANL